MTFSLWSKHMQSEQIFGRFPENVFVALGGKCQDDPCVCKLYIAHSMITTMLPEHDEVGARRWINRL